MVNTLDELDINYLKSKVALAKLVGPDEVTVSVSDLETQIAQREAAQKEITDWRSVAEAMAQDDANWHKLADRNTDLMQGINPPHQSPE
ncbi:hypothetical protein [Yersinia sp. Marseille-Q3913]|uniref:hypothetical protein n=1 Tax=Yersinia sp. Marseille-Q3913 TaxID=2830769 RepID=UPI001BB087EC|nr:hypothetical protein [Yersinia sp. Marseille-Q3913]MBS0056914.1 hypothetical protein [Yersinia sp. Marseille-Q3913]